MPHWSALGGCRVFQMRLCGGLHWSSGSMNGKETNLIDISGSFDSMCCVDVEG